MKQRFITAFILIALCVPCALYGGIALGVLCTAMMCGAILECIRLYENKLKLTTKIILYCVGLTGVLCAYIQNRDFISAYIGLCIIAVLSLCVFDLNLKIDHGMICAVLMTIITLSIYTLFMLHNKDDAPWRIFMLLLGTYLTDALALFCGKAFGKHKLCEAISPNKTVEGALYAYILGVTALLIYVKLTPLSFDLMNTLCCFMLPLFGQIGDLVFSLIKRHAQIKDFGNIFPGHGGVLDRVDSLIFNCLIVYILLGLIK